jgi:hypothetical protein
MNSQSVSGRMALETKLPEKEKSHENGSYILKLGGKWNS